MPQAWPLVESLGCKAGSKPVSILFSSQCLLLLYSDCLPAVLGLQAHSCIQVQDTLFLNLHNENHNSMTPVHQPAVGDYAYNSTIQETQKERLQVQEQTEIHSIIQASWPVEWDPISTSSSQRCWPSYQLVYFRSQVSVRT